VQSDMVDSLDASNPADAAVIGDLKDILGDFFAEKIAEDGAWARTILGTAAATS
jgi:transcription initiation factor TFIID subunit 6